MYEIRFKNYQLQEHLLAIAEILENLRGADHLELLGSDVTIQAQQTLEIFGYTEEKSH